MTISGKQCDPVGASGSSVDQVIDLKRQRDPVRSS